MAETEAMVVKEDEVAMVAVEVVVGLEELVEMD